MRRTAVILVALAGVPAVAASAVAAPRAEVLVVGKASTLRGPVRVSAGAATVKVGKHRCRIGARTALATLAHTGLPLVLRDYGSCSKKPADAAALYVRSVSGQREHGADGWVYKLGPSTPSIGAADPSGAFKSGARVLWFWCRSAAGGCQRTLGVKPLAKSVAGGGSLRVRVTAYDDNGSGVPASGATVALGSATATVGKDGIATVTAPASGGTLDVVASQAGRVRSFPVAVHVG